MLDFSLALLLVYLLIGLVLYWRDRRAQPMTAHWCTIFSWPGRYI